MDGLCDLKCTGVENKCNPAIFEVIEEVVQQTVN